MEWNTLKNRILSEKGLSLIEIVVSIIILGVALPVLISVYGSVSTKAVQSRVIEKLVAYSQDKMEEIVGYKETHWDWYKNPQQFAVSENLANNYHRTVTVQQITNWGGALVNAWEVTVLVTHPQFPNGYKLTTRFTKYYAPK